MAVSYSVRLTRRRTLTLLDAIESSGETTVSSYIAAGTSEESISKISNVVPGLKSYLPDIQKEITGSSTGSVLYWGKEAGYLILPPFPVNDTVLYHGYEAEPLKVILVKDRMIGLVLIRLNRYGIGIFKGTDLLSGKVGTGLIHSRHKKGGSSAHRYERHREKQIEYFFTRVCQHAREQIEPYLGKLEYIYYGGERNTVGEFVEQCSFVQKLKERRMDMLLNIREPKQEEMKNAIQQVYSCMVIKL
jgi:peptide subunit release factor 1 (eRF1)